MRPVLRRIAAVLLAAAVLAPVASAHGASDAEDRIAELEAAIGEASAAEAAALRELGTIRARRAELDAAVAAFDVQVRETETRIAALQADIDHYRAQAVVLEVEAAAAQSRLDEAQARVDDAAAALYRGDAGVAAYREVLDADNVQDAVTGSKYLEHVSYRKRHDVEALAGLKVQIAELHRVATEQRDAALGKQREAQGERDRIVALRAEQQRERDAVAQEESRERALIASIQSRQDEFASEIASLQATSNSVSAFLAARQRSQRRASSFEVARPVPGAVTGAYGPRVHPILGTSRLHAGVDMTAATGTPIVAGAAGVVAWAGPRGGYGNAVIVDHGNQFATVYAHASSVNVSVGQSVTPGQIVAKAGSTGMSTGPHLHFEVRLLGVPVNPVAYM